MATEQEVVTVKAALKDFDPGPGRKCTIDDLREATGLDEPTVGAALQELERRGEIEVTTPVAERDYPTVVTRIFF